MLWIFNIDDIPIGDLLIYSIDVCFKIDEKELVICVNEHFSILRRFSSEIISG
jgi:hypothetical protein